MKTKSKPRRAENQKVKEDVCPMEIGKSYSFRYPAHNFHGVASKLEDRRMLVTDIRDMKLEPLEREWFDANPLINRSRFLVTGQDLDKQAERSFYTGSMLRIELIPRRTSRARKSVGSGHSVATRKIRT